MTAPLQRRFDEFHADNPKVFDELVELAMVAYYRGERRIGIGQLFEVLRWHKMISTRGLDGFKLNNDLRAPYARLIMEVHPMLDGMFETRRSQVDEAHE